MVQILFRESVFLDTPYRGQYLLATMFFQGAELYIRRLYHASWRGYGRQSGPACEHDPVRTAGSSRAPTQRASMLGTSSHIDHVDLPDLIGTLGTAEICG